MSSKRKRTIPGDFAGNVEWVNVMLCVPNTVQWRGAVSGQIYELTRGRAWDEKTGNIKEVQEIAERIYGTMAIDCNNNWERIATALEGVNGKIPNLITLQEFLDDMATSPLLATLAEWVDLTTVLGAILPSIDLRLTPVEWIRFLFEMKWRGKIASSAKGIENWLRLQTLADGGTAVAEGVEAVDAWFDNIADWASVLVQGGSMFAEAGQAYAQLSGLFEEGGQFANPDTVLMAQRLSAALAGGALKIESDCCDLMQGSGIGNYAGTQTITPGAGGPGGGPIIDSEPSISAPIDQGKCNYTAYIVEQYINYLNVSSALFGSIGAAAPTAFAAWLNSIPLIFSSLAVAGGVLVLFGFVIGLAIAGVPLAVALSTLKVNLESTKGQLICDIYNSASTPGQARSFISAWITDGLPVSLPSSWVTYHIDHLFTNSVLNQIFDNDWDIGEFTYNCGSCVSVVPAWQIVNGTLESGSLGPDASYFEIRSVYLTSGGCNRHQAYVVPPAGYIFDIDWDTNDQTYVGCGSPSASASWTDESETPQLAIAPNGPPASIRVFGGVGVWCRWSAECVTRISITLVTEI